MKAYTLGSMLDMYKFDAVSYQQAMTILERLIAKVECGKFGGPEVALTGERRDASDKWLLDLDTALEPLNVPVTKATLLETRQVLADLERNRLTVHQTAQMFLNVSKNLERELGTNKMFVLDARLAAFYAPTEPSFGAEVAAKFPVIADELDQAGKCYACDLPTAAAFHWVRCLEAGIRAISKCLGVPDPTTGAQRNWASIAREMQKAIDAKWPTAAAKDTPEAKQFARYLACLTTFTNPYRNETMHFDAVYTSTAALHLYEIVKGLMQEIASRMDQDGLPKA